MSSCVALVAAAGGGPGRGAPRRKQSLPLGGGGVRRQGVAALRAHPAIDAVRVIIHPDDHDHYATATAGLDLLPPVSGGAQRQDSVRNGLESLAADAPDLVLIHDGARPFPDPATIAHGLARLAVHPSGIAALPLR